MTRDTVLFYCQHLLGIGHVSRSLAICRALLDRFDVVFLQGGPDIGRTIDAPGFEHVYLPPLQMREEDSSLYDPSGGDDLDAVWAARQEALAPVFPRSFAAVIVELYPFGRYKFRPEILGLADAARRANPATRIYCSNRDIMVEKYDQVEREAKIVRILNEHFDGLLIHSDPDVIPMEATFGSTDKVRHMMHYTGFVSDGANAAPPDQTRGTGIIVSLGGGIIGEEMVLACAAVASNFPDREMTIRLGPNTPPGVREALLSTAPGNVRVCGFSDDFRGDLSRAALSISLAGYNTLMDIATTRTPALVYPYMANREQNMRAQVMADRGMVGVLQRDDLAPAPLTAAIEARLKVPPVTAEIDLSGARTTAEIIARETGH